MSRDACTVYAIAAVARNLAIGQGGRLPWGRLQPDMQVFRCVTMATDPEAVMEAVCAERGPSDAGLVPARNVLLMGRRTWEWLPEGPDGAAPLPGRSKVIVTRDGGTACLRRGGADAYGSFEHMLAVAGAFGRHCFVMGGAEIYSLALAHPVCTRLFLTEIKHVYPLADTFFPVVTVDWRAGVLTVLAAAPVAGTLRGWHRVMVSPWAVMGGVTYRFGLWHPAA